jgi:hypothetical protein
MGELFLTVFGKKVILDIVYLTFIVYPISVEAVSNIPFESMTSISVIETPGFRCSVVTPEHHSSMHTLWNVRQEIKCTFPINKEILWIALLASNNVDANIRW